MRLPWRSADRRRALVSVVVPAYGVEAYLPACLDSLLAQTWQSWEAIVVDDGSPDRSRRDRRGVRRTRPALQGRARRRTAGSARPATSALAHARRRVPRLPRLRRRAATRRAVGAGRHAGRVRLRLRHRLDRALGGRRPARAAVDEATARPRPRASGSPTGPEILGDVFAWNKVFRRSFWDAAGLSWPEGIRYEDQPTTTRAFLAGTFDVAAGARLPLAHPRRRHLDHPAARRRSRDLTDRWKTKRMSYAAVRAGRRRGRRGRVRRPGARRRPVALLPGDPRRVRRVVGAAARRRAGVLGRSGRSRTAGCRPCTGCAAGWSSRTGAPTRPR